MIARESVRSSPLPPLQDFQAHLARTQPQPCFIILVIPTPNAAKESATPRHAKSGIASSPCKHDRAAVGVICMHNGVFCTSQSPVSIYIKSPTRLPCYLRGSAPRDHFSCH